MYKCSNCQEVFDEPYETEICLEYYYGVGSQFGNRNYSTMAVCPYCEHDDFSEYDEGEEE